MLRTETSRKKKEYVLILLFRLFFYYRRAHKERQKSVYPQQGKLLQYFPFTIFHYTPSYRLHQDLAEWLQNVRLLMPKSQQYWVQSQHPPTQWNNEIPPSSFTRLQRLPFFMSHVVYGLPCRVRQYLVCAPQTLDMQIAHL